MRRSDDFHVGQRVRLSEHALKSGITLRRKNGGDALHGTVVSIGGPLSIRVRPDGYKTTSGYAASFWEPAE